MPQIHVVYDPNDRLSVVPPDMMQKLGISVVIVRVAEELEPESIGGIVTEAATMLLKQITGGE